MCKLLVINPGSTSTKIGLFRNEKQLFEKTLRHATEEIDKFETIADQYEFRMKVILDTLEENDIDINTIDVVVGRGGAVMPIEGGTYTINELMLEHCKIGYSAQHASNLGAIVAKEIADVLNVPSFVVDPPTVDEMQDIARVTGIAGIERKSKFHALNQKAVARRAAKELGKKYEESNIIVAHLGGGISVGSHENGKVVDVNDAYDGNGPFTPERAGTVPAGDLARMCFSGDYTLAEIKKKLTGKGGLVAHLGTNDAREVSQMAENGDANAKRIYDALAYQVAKEIGSCGAVLKGNVDAIVITGGIAYDKKFVENITDRISFIAPVKIYAGEDELGALAGGALRVLRGEETAKEY